MSIKVEDLRIGNVIYEYLYDINHGFKFIDENEKNVIIVDLEVLYNLDTNESTYAPIELTEDILLKCGFEIKEYLNNYYVIKGMLIWKCEGMLLCNKNGIQLKYLHQLQNLYFALTNEELNVKL